jgi:hypothetical protein
MSFATGMLAQAQTAHANALKDKMTQMDDRRLEQHDIKALRDEVAYRQTQINAEAACVRQHLAQTEKCFIRA